MREQRRDRFGAVTALPLAAAAAGARNVPAAPGILSRVGGHQLGGCLARAQERGHLLHRGGGVVEEGLVSGAQVVLARLAVGRGGEPVFRAAAVAYGADVAVQAVLSEGVALALPEFLLLGQH